MEHVRVKAISSIAPQFLLHYVAGFGHGVVYNDRFSGLELFSDHCAPASRV
jgi:hypothetical protein